MISYLILQLFLQISVGMHLSIIQFKVRIIHYKNAYCSRLPPSVLNSVWSNYVVTVQILTNMLVTASSWLNLHKW